MMRIARYPSVTADVPAAADWAKITSVKNLTIGVSGAAASSKVRKTPSWPRSWANGSLL
jgi:hypothetical protein